MEIMGFFYPFKLGENFGSFCSAHSARKRGSFNPSARCQSLGWSRRRLIDILTRGTADFFLEPVMWIINYVRNITCGRDTWRLKVRVVRLWEVCARDNPANIFSVEMVLVDSEGGRIQASIRKAMLRRFMDSVAEGGVYRMTYFGFMDNGGSYRATSHEFKLLFQARTRVLPAESISIPRFGLDLKDTEYVKNTKGECDYLIDIIGLVTTIREKKQYDRNGRIIRVMDVELTDDKGSVKCSLFGHLFDLMNGDVSIQTMSNSSRLLWNPQIPEAISFKNGIVEHGFDTNLPLGVIGDNDRSYTVREEFISVFPRKTIEDLQLTEEDGIFICFGKVDSIVKDGAWWYLSCTCLKAVNLGEDGEGYFCPKCEANVTDVIPRFRLRLEVNDGHEKAHFVIFDSDCETLFSKKCGDMIVEVKDPNCFEYPQELYAIIVDVNYVALDDVVNHPGLSPISLAESSNPSACLAPEKRKDAARVDVPPVCKKRGKGRALKIEQ
ncbi:hypothetical protein SESBI_39347 [Sesbania bispinosa]|nr:hypothetical protein SESBI_39347 [Sesbania bispinosa]